MAHTLPPSGMNGGYAPARSPAAMIGAIGIPAGIGAFLVAGLAVTVIPDDEVESLIGVLIEDDDNGVRIVEIEEGDWGIGGQLLTASAVHDMASAAA